jgi:ferrous iron transport protein A
LSSNIADACCYICCFCALIRNIRTHIRNIRVSARRWGQVRRSEDQNIRLSDYQKKFNPYKLLQLTHIKWYNKIQNWSKSELTSDEKMNKEKKLIHLTHLSPGKSGIVVEIHGGHGAAHRLEALGLRVGARITKISAQPMHGPITVKVGQTSLAIGYGLAHKVMVEVEE